ncbi:MAG: TIGR02996 domain-containing protein [Polyangiales bacterium]
MIEQLENAIGNDDRKALSIALALFERTRDGEVADVVEALSARVRSAPLSRALGQDAIHTAWLELAKKRRPEDVPTLLEALSRSIDVVVAPHRWPPLPTAERFPRLAERMKALAEFPADPRVSRALIELLQRAPWTSGWGGDLSVIYDSMFALVGRIGDPRALPILRDALERPRWRVQAVRAYMQERLPAAIRSIEATPRSQVPGIASIARELGGSGPAPRIASSGVTEEELLEAVYDDPDDDDARLVLADLLLEREDPRGELLALQFKEEREGLAPKERKRMNALVRAHQEEWLGEIFLVTKNRVFKRGLLESAELVSEGAADPGVWERVLVDPRLSTLRSLDKGKANEELYIRFLASPARRSLRRVQATTMATMKAVAEASAPFERVETVALERPSREALGALGSATTLPSLQCAELTCDAERLPGLMKSLRGHPLLERIHALHAKLSWRSGEDDFGRILDELGTLGPLREVGIVYYASIIRARRDRGELEIALETENSHSLPARIANLPRCARVSLVWTGGDVANEGPLRLDAKEILAALRSRAPIVELDPRLETLFGVGQEIAS